MNSKLAVGLAMFMSSLAMQLSGESNWNDTLTTRFVSGMLLQLSGFILSVWGGIETKPTRTNKFERSTDVTEIAKEEDKRDNDVK